VKLHRGNRRQYARDLLWLHREDYWPHLLIHSCVIRSTVEYVCDIADWDFEIYRTAVAFDAPWMLDGAR